MKKWKTYAAGLLILGAAVGLAGCGSSEGGSQPAASAAGGKTPVKVVVSATEPPLSWQDENGKIQGYEYDVLQAVNQNLKSYTMEIQAVPPATEDVMMESGDAKAATEGYYVNKKRQEMYLIPENPIGASALVIYMSKDKAGSYKNLTDVANAKLKMVPNRPNGGAFRILTDWNEKNNKILGDMVPVQDGLTPAEKVNSLLTGQYDYLIYPNNVGMEALAQKDNFEVVALPEAIQVNKTVILVNKNEKKLAEEIDVALKKLKEDGTLSKISEKWYHADLFKLLDK